MTNTTTDDRDANPTQPPTASLHPLSSGTDAAAPLPPITPGELFVHLDVLPQTKKEYTKKVSTFLDFVQTHGFDKNSFRAFKQHLHNQHQRTTSTKNVYLTAARVYCQQLHAQGYLPIDITKTTKGFSQSRKHKKFGINDDEVAQLMRYIQSLPVGEPEPQTNKKTNTIKKTARLKAIFALLLFQGLRQIEIVRLQRDDVDLAHSVIYVQGKGKTDKEKIFLHPHAHTFIADYITVCDIRSGPLFFSFSGRSSPNGLTTRSLRRIVTDVLQSLDIDKSTHGFRHYFTTTLLKSFGGDILKTKAFTRHASTEMLVVYNDEVNHEKNLPDFYDAFGEIELGGETSRG